MRALYSIGIYLYVFLLRIASLFSEKARLWIKGRENWAESNAGANPSNKPVIWFHCASLGEFEQARPVLEAYKTQNPNWFIWVTFFSPSGYEIRKKYAHADRVSYLPADTPRNAKQFVRLVNPQIAVFVKYEFWYNLLAALKKHGCKTILIAARFRKDQPFFHPLGHWFRKQLKNYHTFHVQDPESAQYLDKIGFRNAVISGDPRYDRVWINAREVADLPEIRSWLNGRKCLVAGSTWPPDEAILFPWNETVALILAPHEIDEVHLKKIEAAAGPGCVRYSALASGQAQMSDILLIDNIGMLMRIYSLAQMAYVGGGFGSGLHNILEPAAFGIPVIFGPEHRKFPEANALIQAGGGFSISNRNEFQQVFSRLLQDSEKKAGTLSKAFVLERRGATEQILRDLSI